MTPPQAAKNGKRGICTTTLRRCQRLSTSKLGSSLSVRQAAQSDCVSCCVEARVYLKELSSLLQHIYAPVLSAICPRLDHELPLAARAVPHRQTVRPVKHDTEIRTQLCPASCPTVHLSGSQQLPACSHHKGSPAVNRRGGLCEDCSWEALDFEGMTGPPQTNKTGAWQPATTGL